MDHWDFPVGARFWKEFTRPTAIGRLPETRVETRLIHRFGPGPDDWIFAAYQWDRRTIRSPRDPRRQTSCPRRAERERHPARHPGRAQCKNCHTKLAERILSFSAIQLSHGLPGDTIMA